MQVSLNELSAVLKQAFEGCGFDAGRYENATQMVLWLQSHGLEGLTLLEASLDQFKSWSDNSFGVLEESKQSLLFDLMGQSVLSSGALVCNLVSAQALDNEFCISYIRNGQDHAFIAKQLIDAQRLGLHGFAYWESPTEALESGGIWQLYRTSTKSSNNMSTNNASTNNDSQNQACSLCPCLDVFNFSQLNAAQHNATKLGADETDALSESRYQLVLAFAKDRAQLDQILSEQSALTNAELLASNLAANNQANYQHALSNGIEIATSLWDRLIALGNNVLVESSEQSRKGAGA